MSILLFIKLLQYIIRIYMLLIYIFPFPKQNSLTADGQKEDFSDLPPNQRRKKLQAKIGELQQKIHLETAARDGLMKMKVVYEANSSLGNPMTVEGQLNESEHKLEKLKIDLKKYQGYLEKANQIPMANNSPQANRNTMNNGHRSIRKKINLQQIEIERQKKSNNFFEKQRTLLSEKPPVNLNALFLLYPEPKQMLGG